MGNMSDIENATEVASAGCSVFVFFVFITLWTLLFAGDPDMWDAIIHYVERQSLR
jgi:hypothetical protein